MTTTSVETTTTVWDMNTTLTETTTFFSRKTTTLAETTPTETTTTPTKKQLQFQQRWLHLGESLWHCLTLPPGGGPGAHEGHALCARNPHYHLTIAIVSFLLCSFENHHRTTRWTRVAGWHSSVRHQWEQVRLHIGTMCRCNRQNVTTSTIFTSVIRRSVSFHHGDRCSTHVTTWWKRVSTTLAMIA